MIDLFDTGFLLVLFDPKARVPHDKSTGKPVVDRAQDRIAHLVQVMSERRGKIIIPAPALAEFMFLAADRRNEYLTIMRRKAVFEIAGFNDPEAVELVEYSLRISPHAKLKARTPETWAKLNYDRQIIAIALTNRVDAVYSMDDSVHALAKQVGLTPVGLQDLPLPPPSQIPLLEDPIPMRSQPAAAPETSPSEVKADGAKKDGS